MSLFWLDCMLLMNNTMAMHVKAASKDQLKGTLNQFFLDNGLCHGMWKWHFFWLEKIFNLVYVLIRVIVSYMLVLLIFVFACMLVLLHLKIYTRPYE